MGNRLTPSFPPRFVSPFSSPTFSPQYFPAHPVETAVSDLESPMSRPHQLRPRIEQLDDRIAPSVTTGDGSIAEPPDHDVDLNPAPMVLQAAALQEQFSLAGKIQGAWTMLSSLPDKGTDLSLNGAGLVSPLGQVEISVMLHMPGFFISGRATGTIVLSNAQGSITLQLVGPPQPGFSPPPDKFQYTITDGTGAYAGASGQGIVNFAESSGDSHWFALTFAPAGA
jgi:hypothetical protein